MKPPDYLVLSHTFHGQQIMVLARGGSCSSGMLPPPLAIYLTEFEADIARDGILIRWTIPEKRSDTKFILERTTQSSHFKPIFETQSSTNSDQQFSKFQFLDQTVPPGMIAYRLKEVSDGKSPEYSKIVVIEKLNQGNTLFFPNPASDILYLKEDVYFNEEEDLIFTNTVGQIKRIPSSTIKKLGYLDISSFSEGIWIIQSKSMIPQRILVF